MLDQNNSLVLIVDMQEKLLKAVYNQGVVGVASKLAQSAKILEIPIIITEQYPQGLGATVDEVLKDIDAFYFEKTSFSAYDEIKDALEEMGRKQVILCGIEAHVCVHQTAAELVKKGYEVHVLKDGVASRKEFEFEQGISLMEKNGAIITCLEIALFELLKSAKHESFKAIQALIK